MEHGHQTSTTTRAGRSQLPATLTSYDLLKSFAVVTMVIDHLGYYIFPDLDSLRLIGRLSFPVWLFLIGYARTRQVSRSLVLGAVFIAFVYGISGIGVLPLNILFTIILARLVRPYLTRWALKSAGWLLIVCLVLFALSFPAAIYVMDYGTQAFIFMIFGYIARRYRTWSAEPATELFYLAAAAALCSMVLQDFLFGFDDLAAVLMYGLSAVVVYVLMIFRVQTYPHLTKRLPGPVVVALKLMGRRTLEIYVVHVVLLQALGLWLFPENFGFPHWQWIAFGPY